MCAAIVTGGAARIGRQICLALSRLDIPIIVHCNKSVHEAADLVQHIHKSGGRGGVIVADLGSDCMKTFYENCESYFGPIGCLIHNASVFDHDCPDTLTAESLHGTLNVNIKAPTMLSCEMFKKWSRSTISAPTIRLPSPCIINILDQKVASTNADNLSYTISKHALHNLTDMLARDFAPHIRVNAVAPGPTLPHFRQTAEEFRRCQMECPLGVGPDAQDIADAVSYLAMAKAVTGQTIFVDGGSRLCSRHRDY